VVDQRLHDGGTGWRRQFGFDRDVGQRDAFQKLSRARSRHRTDSVIDANLAAAGGNVAAVNLVDAQQVEAHCHTDDVDDRIDRSHFVKMDLVDGRAMNFGLGLRHGKKDLPGDRLLAVGDRVGSIEDLFDVRQVAVRVLFGMFDLHVRRSKSAFDHGLGFQCNAFESQ
jgi:hypothetical protein